MKHVIVLGNGQLGLMLGKAAQRLQIPLSMLTMAQAKEWALRTQEYSNYLVTFEQEFVDEDLLTRLRDLEIAVFPSWSSFQLLKNKRKQKEFLRANGFPTSPFIPCDSFDASVEKFLIDHQGAVLKAGFGGYDGNGVWMVGKDGTCNGKHIRDLLPHIRDPYLEQKILFQKEIAAVGVRSQTGETKSYPTVVSIQDRGICFQVEYTAAFASTPLAVSAAALAQKILTKLDYVGVLAVECFAKGEEILINEIAPRVHNSGHFSIDVCAGSQFTNHLLAGLGKPLESTDPVAPAAVMTNLLWPEQTVDFASLYSKLTCGPELPGNVKLHWYGKSEARPRRKMGHFTVYGQEIETCKEMARQILASRWSKG